MIKQGGIAGFRFVAWDIAIAALSQTPTRTSADSLPSGAAVYLSKCEVLMGDAACDDRGAAWWP